MAEAVRAAYRAGQEDETLQPIVRIDAAGHPIGRIANGDYVIFYDIRGEREIELTQSFVDPAFDAFPTQAGRVHFVTMIQYDSALSVRVAFPPLGEIRDTLSEVISARGLRQCKIAESEKAVHVGYFFNGKKEKALPGEERIIIPSPRGVSSYALVPELSSGEVARATLDRLQEGQHALIVTNFANVDVIGHIINETAIQAAVEAVDGHIGRIVKAARAAGYITIVTADHGTVEKWLYPDGTIDTGHTNSPVPFTLIPPQDDARIGLRPQGELADVAPTILQLLHLPIPRVMTGRGLLAHSPDEWLAKPQKVLLLIADGWGWREEKQGNLIAAANIPTMDELHSRYPFVLLQASGLAVGMPEGSVGNSEAGHLHLGAGRRIFSDRVRIDRALQDGTFLQNEAFLWAMRGAKKDCTRLHLLGIVSFYSSHGSVEHLFGLMRLAKQENVPEVYIHAMLGRRGERLESGANYISLAEEEAARLSTGQVVSIIGRYWALDREEHWDRVEKAYRLLVYGEGSPVSDNS